MCVWGGQSASMCRGVLSEVRGQLERVLVFHHVDHRDPNQVFGLGSNGLYPLSNLALPILFS